MAHRDGAQHGGRQHQRVAPAPPARVTPTEQCRAEERHGGKSKHRALGPLAQQPPLGKRCEHHAQADQKGRIAGLGQGHAKGFRQKDAEHQQAQRPAGAQRIPQLLALQPQHPLREVIEQRYPDIAIVEAPPGTGAMELVLRREADAADRRRQFLFMTEAGRALYARYIPMLREREKAMLAYLTAAERRSFERILDKLAAHVPDWAAAGEL